MNVQVLKEAGFQQAFTGVSLSYGTTYARAKNVAIKRLYAKDGGHNKFLESIVVWLDITAPRYWWQQFDTYRIGMTKQSESTMHTLLKHPLTQENFSDIIPDTWLEELNKMITEGHLMRAKALLPESFLQRRIVCTNYKSLRNIYTQRKHHRLIEWQDFCDLLYAQLQYPQFISV